VNVIVCGFDIARLAIRDYHLAEEARRKQEQSKSAHYCSPRPLVYSERWRYNLFRDGRTKVILFSIGLITGFVLGVTTILSAVVVAAKKGTFLEAGRSLPKVASVVSNK
jgi:hypothetical protein